ncbi:hypothetical protein [Endozoicomonas sp. 8E]|uniref:hypothetical protein n=1 Tax=Endozoicomonas sp. 8E TaxID=3035692 RepID=UPI0029391D04|nr:hypothetical protein [Endozoicomonas sp. 8E]WOG29049.1 hypothetical protein P6910_05130 [Endozoicomonas sp. 8E]
MSLNVEQPPETELDHIRDTLTGIISYASKTRAEMHQGFARIDKRFDQQGKEIAALKADNADLKADNAEIKEALKLILSRLPC